jgi:hypothetical protein
VPKNEIQDDALKLALLDLQKENAIVRTSEGAYRIPYRLEVEESSIKMINKMAIQRELEPVVINIVERESGIHTTDSLTRRLQELGYTATFQVVDAVVAEIRGIGHGSIKMTNDRKLLFNPPWEERKAD